MAVMSEHLHGKQDCACGCSHTHRQRSNIPWRLIAAIGIFTSGVVMAAIMALPGWAKGLWMGAAAVLPFWSVLCEAFEELKDRHMGENTLLAIAVIAAFSIGEWTEGTLVILLFSLGEWLEEKAMDYSHHRIEALAAVTPDSAFLLSSDGTLQEISAMDVAVGDTIAIPPHTRVPVDCRVIAGTSAVDAYAITGESVPIAVEIDAELLSGMLNGDGQLTAVALRECEKSAAARILDMVEDAVARKGQSERFITRFARAYTPTVTLLAVLVAVIPALITGAWLTWLYRALAFLVASCPCALVISVPLSFYAGIAALARQGVLVKGGRFVETLSKAEAVAFDKTGTLTTGEMQLTEVVSDDKENALLLAAAMERYSSHPVARAICAAAVGELPMVEQVQEIPAIGMEAMWQGEKMACGGMRLLERYGIDASALSVDMMQADAYLLREGHVVAAFRLAYRLQSGARDTVTALRKMGIHRLLMLTGDRRSQALAVSAAVGLPESAVKAELLPEDKLQVVEQLRKDGLQTVFVGDGVNDAPVLAAADVGVAMGLGSAAAIETADVVLVSEGLTGLLSAVQYSRRVVATVRANIIFALVVKAAVLVLAVCGLAPMWLAVFADMGVTLLTVANALRLLINK